MVAPLIFAEVLDKEPTVPWVWIVHAPVAITGYFCCRRSGWWLLLFAPLLMLLSSDDVQELWDKYVGSAIWRESHNLYVQWHLAMLFAFAGPILGFFKGMRAHPSGR
jgi:hypothetical protein